MGKEKQLEVIIGDFIMNHKLKIAGVKCPSMVDGLGIRCVIFFSGCTHHCKGCHNPDTWDFEYGTDAYDENQIKSIQNYLDKTYIDGCTLSGGEPFDSAEEILQWLSNIKLRRDQDIWLYSGYTLEQIRNSAVMLELARRVNYLVLGPYIEAERITTTGFYGSKNQKIYRSNGGFTEVKFNERCD